MVLLFFILKYHNLFNQYLIIEHYISIFVNIYFYNNIYHLYVYNLPCTLLSDKCTERFQLIESWHGTNSFFLQSFPLLLLFWIFVFCYTAVSCLKSKGNSITFWLVLIIKHLSSLKLKCEFKEILQGYVSNAPKWSPDVEKQEIESDWVTNCKVPQLPLPRIFAHRVAHWSGHC